MTDSLLSRPIGVAIPARGSNIRVVATGLLIVMAAVFLAARYFDHVHPAVGFVRAFAEAAMVGGLADWFAVTALFRRPLGLPIPHTAIVPRNHHRIAETLGEFIETNFLAREPVEARLREVDFAALVSEWLSDRERSAALAGFVMRLVPQALTSIDQSGLKGFLGRRVMAELERIELAPLAAGLLSAVTEKNRHQRLLDELLGALGERGESPQTPRPLEVSLKLSALGQALPRDGAKIALDNAYAICTRAAEVGVWVTVDAEDHTTTDSTLSIVRELRTEFDWLATVLQAYLRRTEADCREFAAAGARIRLCKGAYDEPESVAFRDAAAVTANYLTCLRVLMAGRAYPMVASHDPAIISAVPGLVAETGRGPDDFEYQMLYGIRDPEQRRLADEGNHVRVYVPYGTQWYGYFVRRLAERPANLAFFVRALTER